MSLVLVFLVMLVMVAVLTELRYNASVELDRAQSLVEGNRMRRLADAAMQQAQAALLMDSEAAQAAEATGGAGLGGAPDPAAPSPFGGEGQDPAAPGEPDMAAIIAATDSKLDDWMDSAALTPALGEDWSLCTEVEDEDSKINLLGLWTADQDARQVQHDIVRDLLDKAFEGTSRDISFSDATDILDRLDDWVAGNRGSFDPIPKPVLKKSNAAEQAEEKGGTLDTAVMDTGESNYPLTLRELCLLPGILPEHMSGFVEDDVFHPGLESYLTVFSQLELKPKPKVAEDAFGGSPFSTGSLFDKPAVGAGQPGAGGGGTGGGGAGEGGGTAAAGTGSMAGGGASGPTMEDEGFAPTPTNDGLININTAPLAVLRAIAPTEIPTSFLEKIVEYRSKIDELKKDQALGGIGSLFDKQDAGTADEKAGAEDAPESGFTKSEDEDITQYVFQTPQEAIDKVQKEYGYELALDPGVETTFLGRLTVTSQVFSIKVLVYSLTRNNSTARMEFGRRSSWRTVVWRMLGDAVPHVLTLSSLEPFHDARRLKDYPGDLAQLADDQGRALSNAAPGR